MGAFLIRRIIHMAAVLAAVLVIVSLLLRLIPGDPVDAMMSGNPGMTQENMDMVRDQLGLNDPIPEQIWDYASGLLRGDLGDSLRFRAPVLPLITEKLGPTIELTGFALIIAILIALPLGMITALHRDRPADYIGSIIAVLGISVPAFLLGILFILLFAIEWRIFPPAGYGGSITDGIRAIISDGDFGPIKESFRYLFLPGLTLGITIAAYNARMIRSSMVEVLRQDYIRAARSKGLKHSTVVMRHAFRNALIPVITILGLQMGYLLSGAFVIENVFAWPGIGRFSIQALQWRDYPTIQGVVMITALMFLTINLLVDVLYAFIDPRIRFH
ncbi:MAG: ABC transporter permease [Thermomicrobiales bacterium]|jgi:peptide/nickel transport system permease protein|nr:ABC transporter permease [Thermomicrobiales bacterium]